MPTVRFPRLGAIGGGAAALALMIATPALAQFAEGQPTEYKDGSQWIEGVVVRMLPGDTQVLIAEKPSTFFPEGFHRAYSLSEVRPRQAPQAAPGQTPAAQGRAGPAQVMQAPPPQNRAAAGAPEVPAIPPGAGLLSEQQILDFARQALGPEPYANPNREAALAQVRDFIKQRGVNFQQTLAFDNQLGAIGANSVHIWAAIADNYGVAPQLSDYFGNFALTSQNRGSQSARQAGGRTVVETTDSAARLGSIQISADHTYVWNVLGDGVTLRGTWRELREDEKQAWEGGPAIWLLNARAGQDYEVRGDRQPGYAGWIDVGIGKGRIAVQYGRKM
jgi:hypothetical protein